MDANGWITTKPPRGAPRSEPTGRSNPGASKPGNRLGRRARPRRVPLGPAPSDRPRPHAPPPHAATKTRPWRANGNSPRGGGRYPYCAGEKPRDHDIAPVWPSSSNGTKTLLAAFRILNGGHRSTSSGLRKGRMAPRFTVSDSPKWYRPTRLMWSWPRGERRSTSWGGPRRRSRGGGATPRQCSACSRERWRSRRARAPPIDPLIARRPGIGESSVRKILVEKPTSPQKSRARRDAPPRPARRRIAS